MSDQIPSEDGWRDGKPSREHPIVTPYNSRDDGTLVPVDLSTLPEPAPAKLHLGNRLAVGYPNVLYAEGGQGKSFLALAVATCTAAGLKFCGLDLPTGPVLYLDWELSEAGQLSRAFMIARGLGLKTPPKGLLYVPPMKCLPDLLDEVKKLVQQFKPVLIVVDSMGPAAGGNPEDAQATIALFNTIRLLGVTSLILDHQAKMQQGQDYKKKTIFGSAYKFNLSRCVLHLERVSSINGELRLLLRHTKSNFGPYAEDLGLLVRFSAASWKIEAVDTTTDPAFAKALTVGQKLLAALQIDGPAAAEVLATKINVALGTVKNQLTKLRKENRIEEVGKGEKGKKGKKKNKEAVWSLRKMIVPSSHPLLGGIQDAQALASDAPAWLSEHEKPESGRPGSQDLDGEGY